MSAYRQQTTVFKDAALLAECLRQTFKRVDVHAKAIHLEGYHGDKRTETAEIVIPREFVGGSSNDIGFKRQDDGSFAAIISEYDSRHYGAEFMQKLRLSYTESFYRKQAAKVGARLVSKKNADGKTVLQFLHQ